MPRSEEYWKDPERHRQHQRNYKQAHLEQCERREDDRVRTNRLFMQWMKENTECADCGNYFPHYVMEFDHVKGNDSPRWKNGRRLNLGGMATRSIERICEEMDKCDIVCANCHRIRTHMRRQCHHYDDEYVN